MVKRGKRSTCTHLEPNVDYGEAEALTAYGIIGVKVWIYKGEIFLKDLNKNNNRKIKNVTTNKNKI